MTVQGTVKVEVVDDPAEIAVGHSPLGKPFIRLTAPDGTTIDLTLNLAEMIGGIGRGANQRFGYANNPHS
jgi:hypothetical protein